MADQLETNVPKGGYAKKSRFQIFQHKYAGGGNPSCGGYIEVLEIKNPPEGKHPIVIHEYNTGDGYVFSEWETVEAACAVFEKYWGYNRTAEIFPTLSSFIRRVDCGRREPWFYAKEHILGDCVPLPDELF